MEQSLFIYPQFQPNQLLRSDDLNNSFGYLEEQERITRGNLIGNGIADGLEISCEESNGKVISVNIDKGFAVTPDGYTVSYAKDARYTKYLVKTEPSDAESLILKKWGGIMLLTDSEAKDESFSGNAANLSLPVQDLAGYALVVFVILKKITETNCNPSECNITGSHTSLLYRPVLVELKKLKAVNSFFLETESLRLDKLSRLNGVSSLANFEQRISTLIDTNRTQILNKLEELEERFSFIPGLKKLVKAFAAVDLTSKPSQYYLAFFDDVEFAVNELVIRCNHFINSHIFTRCEGRESGLVALGKLPLSTNDLYRYTFCRTIPCQASAKEREVLEKMVQRLAAMFKLFLTRDKISETVSKNLYERIKIIPCRGYGKPLAMRSIPWYYAPARISKAFSDDWWLADSLATRGFSAFNYYLCDVHKSADYNSLKMFGRNDFQFFRIEGHIDTPVEDAFLFLQNLIHYLDIPVALLKIDLDNIKRNNLREQLEAFLKKYSVFLKDIPKALREDVQPFYKMGENLSLLSASDSYLIAKSLNDVKSYSNLLLKADPAGTSTPVVPQEVKGMVTGIVKELPNFDLSLASPIIRINGMSYMAGVPAGGTFVLLHANDMVIGDLALPYFYAS